MKKYTLNKEHTLNAIYSERVVSVETSGASVELL